MFKTTIAATTIAAAQAISIEAQRLGEGNFDLHADGDNERSNWTLELGSPSRASTRDQPILAQDDDDNTSAAASNAANIEKMEALKLKTMAGDDIESSDDDDDAATVEKIAGDSWATGEKTNAANKKHEIKKGNHYNGEKKSDGASSGMYLKKKTIDNVAAKASDVANEAAKYAGDLAAAKPSPIKTDAARAGENTNDNSPKGRFAAERQCLREAIRKEFE